MYDDLIVGSKHGEDDNQGDNETEAPDHQHRNRQIELYPHVRPKVL